MSKTREAPMKTHQPCHFGCGGSKCMTIWANGAAKCHVCGKTGKISQGTAGSTSSAAPVNGSTSSRVDLEGLEWSVKPYRGLSQKTVEFFGIQTGTTSSGEDAARRYLYPHHPRHRILPKDFTRNRGFTNDRLFAVDKYNIGSSKYITVVEGEDDVPAAWQMLDGRHHVVGFPGAQSVAGVLKNSEMYDALDAYEQIIVAFDNDEAGESACEALYSVFPGKCYRVNMSKFKDPMEFNEAGAGKEFLYAWLNRQRYTPEDVFSTTQQFTDIVRNESGYSFIPTGIEQFDAVTGGLAQGAFTVLQAPEGIGKTELMRYFEAHILRNYPSVPIAVMHLEETKKRGLLGLASYMLETNVTVQDTEFRDIDGQLTQVKLPSYRGVGEDSVIAAISEFSDVGNFHQFEVRTSDDPEALVDRIRLLSSVFGCKYIFFEPIQDLAYNPEVTVSVNDWLTKLSTQLGILAGELDVGIVTIAHENDDGQVRDCRMISKRAHVVVQLARDKLAQDEEAKNTTTLTVLKNRPTSNTGLAGQVKFDKDTFTIKERTY